MASRKRNYKNSIILVLIFVLVLGYLLIALVKSINFQTLAGTLFLLACMVLFLNLNLNALADGYVITPGGRKKLNNRRETIRFKNYFWLVLNLVISIVVILYFLKLLLT